MRIHSITRVMMLGGLVGALACAGSMAREEDDGMTTSTTERDDATTRDTLRDTTGTGDTSTQNPPGYRGMERDTSMFPRQDDTTGYNPGGINDSTGMNQPGTYRPGQDTSATGQTGTGTDTTGMTTPSQDTSSYQTTTPDTSGYGTQPGADSTRFNRDSTDMNPPGAAGLPDTGSTGTRDSL